MCSGLTVGHIRDLTSPATRVGCRAANHAGRPSSPPCPDRTDAAVCCSAAWRRPPGSSVTHATSCLLLDVTTKPRGASAHWNTMRVERDVLPRAIWSASSRGGRTPCSEDLCDVDCDLESADVCRAAVPWASRSSPPPPSSSANAVPTGWNSNTSAPSRPSRARLRRADPARAATTVSSEQAHEMR